MDLASWLMAVIIGGLLLYIYLFHRYGGSVRDWWNRYPRENEPCQGCGAVAPTRIVTTYIIVGMSAIDNSYRLCRKCEEKCPDGSARTWVGLLLDAEERKRRVHYRCAQHGEVTTPVCPVCQQPTVERIETIKEEK